MNQDRQSKALTGLMSVAGFPYGALARLGASKDGLHSFRMIKDMLIVEDK